MARWPTPSPSGGPGSTTSATSRSTLPRERLIVFTGLSGCGQVVAGLRHHLRRGPAPLRRVAVGLRPPVPRSDGQARRRLHRGPVAGHLHRPEERVAQPALDGRHHHRGLRLPPAALRPHRHPALPERRHRHHPPDAPADRRPHPRAARRHPLRGAGAGGARPQGHLRHAAGRPGHAGLRPGPGRRRAPRADRQGRAGPLRAAHDRGRRRPAGPARRHRAPAHRLARDGAAPGRRRGRGAPRAARGRRAGRRDRDADVLASTWPARPAAAPTTSWRPATSRSTRPTAPASAATAWAPASRSTPSWWCPTPTSPSSEGAIAPVGRWAQPVLQPAARVGVRGARHPGRRPVVASCPRQAEAAALRRAAVAVKVQYRNRYGRTRSYEAKYEGVVPYLQRRHSEAESDSAREQIEGYMREVPCPECGGARLKPLSLAVTIDGHNIAEISRHVDRRGRRRCSPASTLHRARPHDRRPGGQGDQRPHGLPARRRPRLPHPGPLGGHAGRRRGPAHPAGLPDRQRPGRRALRARRAVDRPAPARQPPAHRDARAAARPRQHRARRRARRGDHQGGRPRRRHRARVPASTAATSSTPARSRACCKSRKSITGQYLSGKRKSIPVPAAAAQAGAPTALVVRGAREHNLQGHRRRVPARLLRRGHRRVGLGQVDARQRHPPAGR